MGPMKSATDDFQNVFFIQFLNGMHSEYRRSFARGRKIILKNKKKIKKILKENKEPKNLNQARN